MRAVHFHTVLSVLALQERVTSVGAGTLRVFLGLLATGCELCNSVQTRLPGASMLQGNETLQLILPEPPHPGARRPGCINWNGLAAGT